MDYVENQVEPEADVAAEQEYKEVPVEPEQAEESSRGNQARAFRMRPFAQ